MSDSTYPIQRLSIHNLGDVAKLHAAVYEKRPPFDFFLKYDTAFTGAEHIGFMAYDKGIPIAYYGVIPCFMRIKGKATLVAQSTDTMTHPGYRHQGLFAQLARLTYELCEKEGIQLIFGFPNQNSLPGFINSLNWQVKETMDCFIIPVDALPLEMFSLRVPLFAKPYAYYAKWVLKKYAVNQKGTVNSVLGDCFDGIVRDDNFLNYKTYSTTQVINILGVKVWIKLNNGMLIGDMAGMSKVRFNYTMRELVKIARRLGVQQLQFHASPGTDLHALFSTCYWPIPSFQVIFKCIAGTMPKNSIKFTLADIDIF
jgi:GNAT superfamily N-acetyltransferase